MKERLWDDHGVRTPVQQKDQVHRSRRAQNSGPKLDIAMRNRRGK